MRTDATISKRKVKLPGISASSILGFDKWVAEPGDIIRFLNGKTHYVGRVIGRVDAPPCGESPAVKGHICCVIAHDALGCLAEFWVDPVSVWKCTDGKRAREMRDQMKWLLADDFTDQPVDVLRTCGDKSPWYDENARDSVQLPDVTVNIGVDNIGYQMDIYRDGKIIHSGCRDLDFKDRNKVIDRFITAFKDAVVKVREAF